MKVLNKFAKKGKKFFVLLVDPDKQSESGLTDLAKRADKCNVDIIFFGGSLITSSIEKSITTIKDNCNIPVVLFPGSLLQISENADAILLLSLISGRNPDFLIGNQVVAAPMLRNSGLEVIPTGYILVDCGKFTSVEYMSNTKPIPSDKYDIAVATAMAGEMLGQKLIYLEGGSGALNHVSDMMIRKVKEAISIPLIVGGGIKTEKDIKEVCQAGADIVVVGNAIESDSQKLESFADIIHHF